ncbi:MAG TPA: acyl-CoA reductase [Kofleriaceae bacterium]|jgi:hypothetical protein|nr:acyl-CoA reductase [Kofleriaceae bacterium]
MIVELASADDAERVIDRLRAAPAILPFTPEATAFVAELGAALLADPRARVHPELMSLGFFVRKAELAALARDVAAITPRDTVRVPQGLVFHVPPANVDTIFAYSWLTALVAGNRNVVRLSSRASPVVAIVVEHVARLLAEPRFAVIAAGNALVRYGHDLAITRALSAACDLRVVWGGDASVGAIREAALAPHARDLTFPDRFSFAALRAAAVLALDDAALGALGDALANDIFWFDQAACSSPRLIIWVGEGSREAGDRLFPRLAARGAALAAPEPAHVMAKELYAARAAADGAAIARRRLGAELTVLRADDAARIPRDHPGAGLVWECAVAALQDVAPWVIRRDQTLVHFGFAADELRALVASLAGRGVDRLVAPGRALAFHRFWDGHDLAAAFTRLVHVEAS